MILIGLAVLLTGCVETARDRVIDEGQKKGWTELQCEAAYDYILKECYMELDEDGVLQIIHSEVTIQQVCSVINTALIDIEYVLDPNQAGWRRILTTMPTQAEALLRLEPAYEYLRCQLGQANLFNDFRELLGYKLTDEDKEYHLELLWHENTDYDFTVDHIERARQSGTLKETERQAFIYYTPFGEKIRDPKMPGDINAYVWREKKQGFEVVSHAILNDELAKELKADYCEIYRVEFAEDQIIRESLPCLRAFRTLTGNRLGVMVIDYDREGESGFGIIDAVKSCRSKTGSALYKSHSTLFDALSTSRQERKEEVREPWTLPILKVDVVQVGETEEYLGEFRAEGWEVPYEYKDEYGLDWQGRLSKEEKEDGSPFYTIASIVKIWVSKVWEYYAPAEEFQGDLISGYASLQELVLQFKGEATERVHIDKAIDGLTEIVYEYGGQWYMIYDHDGIGVLQYRLSGVSSPSVTTQTNTSESSQSLPPQMRKEE